jgi:hypothetical protein
MARTIKIKVFQYDELTPAAQQRAREWFRSGDDSHERWSEFVTMDLKTVAAFMGWTVKDTFFSGFSSQGDGAKFTGTWSARDVPANAAKLEEHAPSSASPGNLRLWSIMEGISRIAAEAPEASASVASVGHYAHSGCTSFESDDLSPLQLEQLTKLSRSLMDWYYRELEASYEAENSDERVAETIRANEYEFKKNGDRFAD